MAVGRDGGRGGLMGKRRIGQLERKIEIGRKQRGWKREGVRDGRRLKKKKKRLGAEGMTE